MAGYSCATGMNFENSYRAGPRVRARSKTSGDAAYATEALGAMVGVAGARGSPSFMRSALRHGASAHVLENAFLLGKVCCAPM